jgi:hypothetical protein
METQERKMGAEMTEQEKLQLWIRIEQSSSSKGKGSTARTTTAQKNNGIRSKNRLGRFGTWDFFRKRKRKMNILLTIYRPNLTS